MSWRSGSQTEPSKGSDTFAAATSRAMSSAGRMRPGEDEPGRYGPRRCASSAPNSCITGSPIRFPY
jgi:hypothetical protein